MAPASKRKDAQIAQQVPEEQVSKAPVDNTLDANHIAIEAAYAAVWARKFDVAERELSKVKVESKLASGRIALALKAMQEKQFPQARIALGQARVMLKNNL